MPTPSRRQAQAHGVEHGLGAQAGAVAAAGIAEAVAHDRFGRRDGGLSRTGEVAFASR
ncbi:hypothetical protein LP420_17670 [Massilia sp. B-10]|nr:hypothetical protein LP420_17670 [Massilia sp. B-10]